MKQIIELIQKRIDSLYTLQGLFFADESSYQKLNDQIYILEDVLKEIQKNYNESCFERISEEVFNETKSLDDFIIKMGTTKDGRKIDGVKTPEEFKSFLTSFKEFLSKEFPDFTLEEILKYDKYYHKLNTIYTWHGCEDYLRAIEYELRNKK